MKEELLEEYIKQYIEAHSGSVVNFVWKAGESTLRTLDFFKKAVKFQKKYIPQGWKAENLIKTSAVFIDDQWTKFLK
jgi:uncharacterized protein